MNCRQCLHTLRTNTSARALVSQADVQAVCCSLQPLSQVLLRHQEWAERERRDESRGEGERGKRGKEGSVCSERYKQGSASMDAAAAGAWLPVANTRSASRSERGLQPAFLSLFLPCPPRSCCCCSDDRSRRRPQSPTAALVRVSLVVM